MDTMPVNEAPSATATRQDRRFDMSRWSGLLFVVLAVPAVALGNPTNPFLDSAQDYTAAYADGAGQAPLGRLLGVLAVIPLLWALARLRAALPLERGGIPAAVIGLAGVIYAAAWIGSVAAAAAMASAVDHAEGFGASGFEVVPETAFVVDFVADGFSWAGMTASAVLAWGVALAGRRAGVLPGWLGWVGIVLVPLLPLGWLFFMVPVAVFLLWFAAVVAVMPMRA